MGFKCKLIEKDSNPMQEGSPKKWYGTTQSETPLSGKAMTKAAAENTTLAPIELEAALDLLANFIPQQLLQGHTVTLPELRDRIRQNIEFEDGGVKQGGISYATRADYYTATGQGPTTQPGTGTGEDDGDHQLG